MKNQQKNFRLPVVDSTPMGSVQMSAQFYRGLLQSPQRTKFGRIAAVLFGFMFLCLGLFTLIMGIYGGVLNGEDLGAKIFVGILSISLGSLFTFIGGKILYLNILK